MGLPFQLYREEWQMKGYREGGARVRFRVVGDPNKFFSGFRKGI